MSMTPQEIEAITPLLGKRPDKEIAREFGRSALRIAAMRRDMGIPALDKAGARKIAREKTEAFWTELLTRAVQAGERHAAVLSGDLRVPLAFVQRFLDANPQRYNRLGAMETVGDLLSWLECHEMDAYAAADALDLHESALRPWLRHDPAQRLPAWLAYACLGYAVTAAKKVANKGI